ncbi:acetoin utilization protein AcuC [Paenibacillus lutrae]|uniref:Acetoin utilization protein AcuC n=1 Tax=Paenibacillus lutrae TaxID=2078573 RepID=A0A7X3FGX0_9BACL|nr:acetoin utilization protein AcuC [Paenibacillus lutrae]MVO99268.1 acetoin utilization protein AcuC [Paenibacillus lutrae]
MKNESVFVYNEHETTYKFNDEHPFNQKRLLLTVDLLRKAGALQDSQIITPRSATEEELARVHQPEFIEAVKALSEPSPASQWVESASRYGLDTEDTPYFALMHEVTSMVVGGSITAAETVMSGAAKRALHLGGGLHHALQSKGAGFCVYNDASAAIAHITEHYNARVLYIDTDVHHGDGVQWSFYSDPRVCTFSIHETGKYLFPGTGDVTERGEGEAFGTCVNVPVEPYTEDDSWLESFEQVLEPLIERFKPDIIVSQHGCDAHALDPLAHVHCSMRIYKEMPKLIRQWADRWCEGRWVALGGGGYDIWRVVPRAWSLLWLVMSDHPLIQRLEQEPLLSLPSGWLIENQAESPVDLPDTWLDQTDSWEPIPRREVIVEKNKKTVEIALLYVK